MRPVIAAVLSAARATVAAAMMALLFSVAAPARQAAAQDTAQVVLNCGTPNQGSLPVGNLQPLTQDTTGTLCTKAGGTGAVQQGTGNTSNPWTVQGAVPSAGTYTGNPVPVGGAYTSPLPIYTSGQQTQFFTDTRGSLNVSLTQAGTALVAGSSNADTLSSQSSSTLIETDSIGRLYNGSSFDRAYSVTAAIAGAGTGVQAVSEVGKSYSNITTATTTTVKSGAGYFHQITVNTCVASATITMYDNTAASGSKIGTITLPSTCGNAFTLVEDVKFGTGLTIVTSGATDLTVSYF